jgi:hypothetical protein
MLERLSKQVATATGAAQTGFHLPHHGCLERSNFLPLGQKEFERARRSRSSLRLIRVLIEPPPTAPRLDQEVTDPRLSPVADLCHRHRHRADLLGHPGTGELALLLVNNDEARQSDPLVEQDLATAAAIPEEQLPRKATQAPRRSSPFFALASATWRAAMPWSRSEQIQ